ncbi:MAG: hypothetical protein A2589_01490 [Candidatus Vogelbacteria bacterium RIFOXYD1_FULL_46_19]|uniref:Uncharacterized protein n=1 Tax=Candidatus Vogelbacteria bacterium RIFOXYD1_FULL_46_19 TaxID=1802439 RepID=A0A1G2QGJ3_9BACT|nr:MAG: hypothetical protein A2589_01490 [Candidatus Vogelbacteria bacterium RIFOXYD1_FULL_46_19]
MSELVLVRKVDIDTLATIRTPGYGYDGQWAKIKILLVPAGDNIPNNILQALVGLSVETCFTQTEIIEMCGAGLAEIVPPKTRLAYVPVVAGVLTQAGKSEEAKLLREIATNFSDMVAFPEGCFEVV